MRKTVPTFIAVCLLATSFSHAAESRTTIELNGVWEFDQTRQAFPPRQFTRTCPVPGLISQAKPRIDQYDVLVPGPPKEVDYNREHNLLQRHYEPQYNWYRRTVTVPKDLEGSNAVLTVLKSKYVTQVLVNGWDAGVSMACYTPVEFPVTEAIRFGEENEILIRVGDRAWLPSAAAGSTDKEKVNYLPGIWDDVSLSFTGPVRVHRALMLPSEAEKKVTAKILLRSFHPAQAVYGTSMETPCEVEIKLRESRSGKAFGKPVRKSFAAKHDNVTKVELEIPMDGARSWTPDEPFLYTAETAVREKGKVSDRFDVRFGMRDFRRQGRHFALNGKRYPLRGTNITLHRFFEDPDCAVLPWDRKWVKRLLIDIPKQLEWNAMRICVGIAPRMWYDIADEHGLLLQNEWLYWQNHGWDEQIRAEYTDWVWTDGNHPSIVIWDAINENWDDYVGNELIPELKTLDPTRIWDAGYMTGEHMTLDEMDEPHPYRAAGWRDDYEDHVTKNPYALGDLHDWPRSRQGILESSAAQLVNEYGWMWLWRDGRPAKLMQHVLPFYLGSKHTTHDRRFFQAYWEQLQTEWLRTERSLAGVLCFCYLTNNYGYTGDWFIGEIKDLQPGPALEWFRHCFAPAAVFIDLVDERYTRHVPAHAPGESLSFNLVGVNDTEKEVRGDVKIRLLDSAGKEVHLQNVSIAIPGYLKRYVPITLGLPDRKGGYLLRSEFRPEAKQKTSPVISRRYLKVGDLEAYEYHEFELETLR